MRESYEGAAITNTDLPQTTVFAHYVERFQGRTGDIYNGNTAATWSYDAPEFAKQIVLAGAGPTAYAFEDIYALGAINTSISNLKLTAQYVQVTDVNMKANFGAYGVTINKTDDISFYYTEANYILPVSNFKLNFDANYRGSRAGDNLDTAHIDGNMIGLRAGFSELYGFGASVAYTTVNDDDDALLGLGNGPLCYTMLSIRGPLVFNGYSGMDSYKIATTYDFSKVGIMGLTSELAYVNASQDASNASTITTAAHTHADIDGYSVKVMYAVPALKGLSTDITYVTYDKEVTNDTTSVVTKKDTDELWVNVNYKF